MAECYLCGAWIGRGMGYRRQVQTGSSVRAYATRRGGASFSTSYALRTLCHACAEIQDRTTGTNLSEVLLVGAGWAVSAWMGWYIAGGQSGWAKLTGFVFMLGLPVFLVQAIIRHERRKAVVQEARDRASRSPQMLPPQMDDPVQSPRRSDETGSTWLQRVLPDELAEYRDSWEDRARRNPPRAGQTFLQWAGNVTAAEPEPANVPDLADASFREGDTIQSWAGRAAAVTAARTSADQHGLEQSCLKLAHYIRPRVGERISDYVSRANARLQAIDTSLDPRSAASARLPDETLREWLERVALLCLPTSDAYCLEDILERLATLGSFTPPQADESIASWLERMLPLLDT